MTVLQNMYTQIYLEATREERERLKRVQMEEFELSQRMLRKQKQEEMEIDVFQQHDEGKKSVLEIQMEQQDQEAERVERD